MTKKPVGLSYFNKKVKELEEKKVFYFDEEKDEYITYSVKFSMDKIEQTIEELVNTILYCNDEKLDYLDNNDKILNYLEFLTFKNFTDTEKLLKDKDFDYKLKFAKNLHKVGITKLFIDNVFDSIEVNKVIDKLLEVNQKALTLLPEIDKLEKAKEKIPKLK